MPQALATASPVREFSGTRSRLPLTRVLVGAIVVLGFALQMRAPPSGDVSWLMTVAERMLDGQQLYRDIFELNPPMCALLYLPWVWLARQLGIAPEGPVVAATLLLALLSLRVSAGLLARTGQGVDRDSFWFAGALVLIILPGHDFAEREHFALIGALPALVAIAVRSGGATPGRGLTVLAGIGAGLCVAIKPHFALALIFPALLAAWRARSLKPLLVAETLVGVVVVAGFWAITALVFPAFFSTMLPLAASIYAGDRLGWLELLFGRPTWPLWAIALGMAALYRTRLLAPLPATLTTGALGFFLAYLVEGKGFSYHLAPALGLVTLTLLMSFLDSAGAGRRALPKLAAALLVGLPVISAGAVYPERAGLADFLRQYGPGLKLANLTPQLETTSPLQREIGASVVNSGPFLWMALGAIRIEATSPPAARLAEAQAIEQRERDMLRADFTRTPPDIVLADGDAFDWLAWAKRDPALAQQLDGYSVVRQFGDADAPLLVLARPGLLPKR